MEQGAIRRSYLDGPFGQIHLRSGGLAKLPFKPLYCLHQAPKSGLEMETIARAMAPDRVVVAPDLPGHGLSDRPGSEGQATIPAYAEAMWAVADGLGHEAIDFFGNHTGGMVAVEMARQRPERVGRITLVSALVATPEELSDFKAFFQPIPLDDAGTRFSTMWSRIAATAGPGMTLEMRARSFMHNLLGGEAYEWGHQAAFAHAPMFVETLKTLAHPVRVLNPADGLEVHTRRAADFLGPDAIIELPDWGHGFLDLRAAEVCALLRGFEVGA
jgi:pimeloyl-ACP methyl ester carboxylesterase